MILICSTKNLLSLVHIYALYFSSAQYIYKIIMGCIIGDAFDSSQKILKVKPCKIGSMEVKIKHVFLRDISQGQLKETDLSIKIWVSNQFYHIPLVDVLSNDEDKNKFKFLINSFYKQYGRTLNIQVWNIKNPTQANCCFGLIDLEQFHNSGGTQQTQQILYLNFTNRQGGFVKMELKFIETPFDQIKFNLQEVTLRSKTSTKKKQFTLRITVGEQVYETPPQQCQDDNLVIFNLQTIDFRVPRNIYEGQVEFLEKDSVRDISWGKSNLELKPLIQSRRNLSIEEALEADHTKQISGSLRFVSISSRSLEQIEVASPTKRGRKKRNNITSIRVIDPIDENEEHQLQKKHSIKVPNDKPNQIKGAFKLQPVPTKAFRGKLQPIKVQNKDVVEEKKLQRKLQNKRNLKPINPNPIKVGSLPPKNIQAAMFELLANKEMIKNY